MFLLQRHCEIPSGHKGSFGDVLFVGERGIYSGAPYFAAYAFLKAGGGYSRLAAPASMIPVIAAKAGEIVFVPQKENEAGSIAMSNKNELLALSRKTDMSVLGPGLSLNEESQELARQLTAEIESPLLLDGDAITALCKDRNIILKRRFPTVLTPHMGEMSRLSDKSAKEIEEDKIGILRQMTAKLNAIIVLKGPHSLIGFPDGSVYVNMSGNSGMATAGSGDVLCGTISAMYSLCPDMETAVRKGVFIHGLAGDLAAEELGKDGMTAQDILNFLPYAMKLDREGGKEKFRELYNGPEVI
ncbi:MAG: NAD(P)H-hydrate dehydratase [Desulfobacterales bacterium]